MSREPAKVTVLSVVGPGRSGSTLVAGVLSELAGVIDVGELRWLWRRGLQEGRPCGCGLPPAQCPLWSEVVATVLGAPPAPGLGWRDDPEVARVVAAQGRLAQRRVRVRQIRSASRPAGNWPDLHRVRSATERVVGAVASTTGSHVVVDASKRPMDAAVFAGLDSVDQYVLHLVRDPRAVAFSWGRAKPLPTAGSEPDRMARRGPVSSAVRWLENNAGSELLRRQVPPDRWLLMRYEDFAADPTREIDRLISFLGLDASSPIEGNEVRLGTHHTVAGNPVRFRTGLVPIRLDDEWRHSMSRHDKAMVTAMTMALLTRYGYPLSV